MSKLLGALESMKAKLEEDGEAGGEDQVDEAMLAVMEADQEVADETTELMELDDVVEEAEVAVERLEGIRDAIAEFGISKSMMKAADPKGELCEAGVVASYEELEDTPVKDENADAAVEGIGAQIKKIWLKLKEIFKAIWNKLKSWGAAIMRGFRSHETLLVSMIAKVQKVDVDEAAFGKREATIYAKADFDKVIKAIEGILNNQSVGTASDTAMNKLAKAIEGSDTVDDIKAIIKSFTDAADKVITKDVTLATGLFVNKEGTIERKAATIKRNKVTMKAAGWNSSAVVKAMRETLDLINLAKRSDKAVELSMSMLNDTTKVLENQTRKVEGLDDKEVRRRNTAINGMKTIANTTRKIVQIALSEANTLSSVAVTLGKAAASSAVK